MDDLPLAASVVSPSQASRIELAIRRYEEEIQNICKSNAQLRASMQTRPAAFAQSYPVRTEEAPLRYESKAEELRLRPVVDVRPRESLGEVRKMQQRISSLEGYVDTLENKVRERPIVPEISGSDAEVTALRKAVALQREENDVLKDQVERLSMMCREAEQRLRLASTDQTSWQQQKSDLEDTITELRSELRHVSEERNHSDTDLQSLKTRYQQLQAEYTSLIRTKGSDSAVVQERINGLEAELAHYKTLAMQREEENVRLAERLRNYVQTSEEAQEELKYRIEMLETRQLLAKSHSGELDNRPRREVESVDRKSESYRGKTGESTRRAMSKSGNVEREERLRAPRPKSAKSGDAAKAPKPVRKQSKERS